MTREEKIDKLIDLLAEEGLIVLLDDQTEAVSPPSENADISKIVRTS